MDDLILKHVLYNSIKYDKVDANSILGKVIAEMPESKNNIKSVIRLINEKIREVSRLSPDERKEKLEQYDFRKKEEKKELELPNVKGKVIMRFAPHRTCKAGNIKFLFLRKVQRRIHPKI